MPNQYSYVPYAMTYFSGQCPVTAQIFYKQPLNLGI